MEQYNHTITNFFKLPIEYVKHFELDKEITHDLELQGTKNVMRPLLYGNTDNSYNTLSDKWSRLYTTNVKYLKQMQSLLKKYQPQPVLHSDFKSQWVSFINETSFKQKYSYVEWDHLEFCNRSEQIMQIISVYNLASPVLSLLVPILFFIVPFVILKFVQKVPITFTAYKDILLKNFKHNIIGQLVEQFTHGGNWDKKMYLLFGCGFYVFSIYQNILTCIKFYNNVARVKKMLYHTKCHVSHCMNNMDMYITQSKKYKVFKDYCDEIREKKEGLQEIYDLLSFIKKETFTYSDLNNIGSLLRALYLLYDDVEYNKIICYSFGFLEYLHILNSITSHIHDSSIHRCSFTKKKETALQEQYYIHYLNKSHRKNTLGLSKNYIITGPNASGKTTLLKTTFINLLLSQQIGYGCYRRATIQPYTHFYCYLNIPDTSDRDSLFQAEARRCLTIVNEIKNSNKRSFCIFDELYSGTNPEEAIIAAKAYLQYLTTLPITFLLTTHYYSVCDLEETNPSISNIHMNSYKENDTIRYLYTIEKGVSKVKGGTSVLKQLDYPPEIIEYL